MGKGLFSACFGTTKAVVDAEQSTSATQRVERPLAMQLQLVSWHQATADLGALCA